MKYIDWNATSPAEVILERRSVLHMTQIELALHLDLEKPNFITLLEKNMSSVPLAQVVALSDALELDETWFLELVMRTAKEAGGRRDLTSLCDRVFTPENLRRYADLVERRDAARAADRDGAGNGDA